MPGGSDTERLQRVAQLADLRQKLALPVGALLEYAEILREDADRNGPEHLLPDLERIADAGTRLQVLINSLLDQKTADELFSGQDEADAQKKLRHDLRTPLNAIIGYGEMIREDLTDAGETRFDADLAALLAESGNLLKSIDRIVDFSRSAARAPAGDESTSMFSELAANLAPVELSDADQAISGHILVVDDLESNRIMLSRRLHRDGHAVTVAESGKRALDLMRTESFDLVLLDLMMPGMNGFEVLAHIKADNQLYKVPVIMISALDELDSVARCIEAGAEDYLPKPFNPVLLKARIRSCLDRKQWREREQLYLDRLEDEKEKFENLLLNILPRQIVGRLNGGETVIADRFDNVSVLFSDLVGFTKISSRLTPAELVTYLNTLFSEFDGIASELGVEKIKMIGDAYMVAAGVPEQRPDHAEAIAHMALRMIEVVERLNQRRETPFKIRIGIDSGPVVAGIIGTHRFVYDIWGNTVNVASRMESLGEPNRIHISGNTARLLGASFETEAREKIAVKGKGLLQSYFLNSARRETPAKSAT
jgi:adenylate cyclase